MRVYELAKQHEMSSKELLPILEEIGVLAKSHMTVVSDEDAALVIAHLAKGSADAVADKHPRYEVERARPKAKRMTAREKLAAKRQAEAEQKKAAPAVAEAVPTQPAAAGSATESAEQELVRRPRVQAPAPKTEAEPVAAETPTSAEPVENAPAAPVEEKPAEIAAAAPPRPSLTEIAKAAARTQARIHRDTQTRVAGPETERRPVRGTTTATTTETGGHRGGRRAAETPAPRGGAGGGGGRGGKGAGAGVDASAIQKSVRQTLARLEVPRRTGPAPQPKRRASRKVREDKKDRAARHRAREEAQRTRQDVLRVTEFVTVQELGVQLDVKPTEIIGKLMGLGTMATINQRLERDAIEMIANEYEIEVEWLDEYGEDMIPELEEGGEEEGRSPVVTVMGHVDHGKTSLLDYIRNANVIAGEAGGITQHIGAYRVETSRGQVTFLDTPGHEAFSAMRARGAQATDIVVIVVAADDKVMPQTVEAIDHARASDCPIIVAINKIDLPAAEPAAVKQQLMQHNILIEEFGGDVQCVEISAKKGDNVEQLLEAISLQAELMELKAVHEGDARGTVIESQKDPGRGISFTVLVSRGTLNVGDAFVAGLADGRVRAMRDEHDREVSVAVPGQPVVVLGANDVPAAGDIFVVMGSEREARDISSHRQRLQREQTFHAPKKLTTLENLFEQIQEGDLQELALVVKGDVAGSVEALCDALMKLSTEKVAVRVIHKGVGAINESDIHLAASSQALIIGFHLHPPPSLLESAKANHVSIETYNVIYEAVEQVKQAMTGLLKPIEREVAAGTAEVRELFKVPRIGVIAGCYVTEGSIKRNSRVRVIRDQVEIYAGAISSLKRFKEDAREVASGFECGIGVQGFNDVKVGDLLQTYDVEEVAQEL